MGPRVFSVDDVMGGTAIPLGHRASMGPRVFSVDDVVLQAARAAQSGFNGATLLQRG